MGGSGGGAPEGRKMFRKFVEICNMKFNNFQKLHEFFARSWTKI